MKVAPGRMGPLPLVFSHEGGWPVAVIPLAVNVIQHPLPTARRCFRLGQAIRKALRAYPEDLKVAIIGTGGMSHQLHGERFGHLNPEFDQRWLDLIENDPERLANMNHRDIMAAARAEAGGLIMWLLMRGAMTPKVPARRPHKHPALATREGVVPRP